MSRYAAVILAAGRGSRFTAAGGRDATKLVALHAGEPLVRHVVRAALGSAARPVIVVTGHARSHVEASLAGQDIVLVHNARFGDGLSGSLQCALAGVPHDAEGALVLLADMPRVASGTIDALIRRADQPPLVDAVVPVNGGVRGNPVLLRRSLFARLASLTGDQGGRRLLNDPAVAVAEIEQPRAILLDIDRPDDLRVEPD